VTELPGSQLNNYDLVIEFSEQAFSDLLSAFFDTIQPIGNILHNISGGIVPGLAFALTVSFDVPTDIPLPPGTIDTLDIRMTLGTDGSVGTLRFVARVDVKHTSIAGAEVDLVQLDLSNAGLLYTNIDLFGVLNSTNGTLTSALHTLGSVPLLPVPVNRSSTSPTDIVSADMRIIDDTSPSHLDDSALLLTFGGDSPGNRNGFTQGIVPLGDTGAIGVSFNWICNIIRPQLAAGLSIPVSDFDAPCHLNTTVNLPGDHSPQLTGLDLTLVDGAIAVSASVAASDTGWNASATVGGSILIAIQNGNLVINTNIADPQINVSLDWWVWIASAVVGAITGGIIAGVIGAVIGAIVVPLVIWIASNIINGIITNIADQIVSALRQLNLNVNVPAIGVNIVFQDVNIDDVVIGTQVQFIDNAPIRSQGEITVFDGQRLDLDNGSVGDASLPGADLAWVGTSPRRLLETLCCDMLARTGHTVFDLTRSQLYRLFYETGVSIPESELGIWPNGSSFIPSDLVYGVETDEGRFSIVQVVGAGTIPPPELAGPVTRTDAAQAAPSAYSARAKAARYTVASPLQPLGYIVVRYRTFEKPAPHARTIGGVVSAGPIFQAGKGVVGADVPLENATFVPTVASSPGQAGSLNPGTWTVTQLVKNPKQVTIKALTPGIRAKAYRWSINGKQLRRSKGTAKVGGSTVNYEISRDAITVAHDAAGSLSFQVGVTAVGKDGSQLDTTTCVETGGETSVTGVATATWPVFQGAFLQTFGNIDP
jgi:hypothetical protein